MEASAVTRRLALPAEAIAMYPTLQESRRLVDSSSSCLHPKPQEYVVHEVNNWPSEDLLRDVGGLTVGMMLWFSNFAYGGLHAAA